MSTAENGYRTHYEVLMDIRYNVRLNELHKRLYSRFQGAVTICAVLGLTGALTAVNQGHGGTWFVATAVLLAVVSALNAWCNFGANAVVYGYMQRRYEELMRDAHLMPAEQLDAAYLGIDTTGLNYIEGLCMPAYNNNLCSYGHRDAVQPLTRWQRFMAALA